VRLKTLAVRAGFVVAEAAPGALTVLNYILGMV
jgi:hypothetical protein